MERPGGFREGGRSTPVVIIWPCPLSPSSYAAAGQQVGVPSQRCPHCQRALTSWGGYWRWLRAPPGGEWRIWIRRGRCSGCRRTHALLPDLVLARRLDAVAVIGRGLALKVVQRLGLRTIAEQLGVPHTTVRSWWRRFRARAPTLVTSCTALAVDPAGVSVQLAAEAEQAALEALAVAWHRAQVRFGARISGVWPFWSRISGGWALGANTSAPWAGLGGAGWMAPSPPRRCP
jgi:transposase-like protein